MSKLSVRNEAWRRGLLEWKLKPVQKGMRNAIKSGKSLKYILNCSRRLGKSYLMCLMAVEKALTSPHTQVRYAAPTQKALKKITQPHMVKILSDCPAYLRPTYRSQEQVYLFPNGSEIHLAGVNSGHAENLRGTEAHLFLIDEAGTVSDLRYLVEDIAMPQLLTTGGQIIMASTPPKTPAHDFVEYALKAETDGNYSHYTIFDAGYDQRIIDTFQSEAGGKESSTWRREYLAEFVVDEESALIPEWNDVYSEEFKNDQFWQFHHKYESLDIGVRDLTVCLFAHYDFKCGTLYIHDEVKMSGPEMTTERLAEEIKQKEGQVFGKHRIYRRVSDIDLLLINDLRKLHGLYFRPTDKGNLEQMVNEVRIWTNSGRVIVHPRCQQLLGCLKYGIWTDNRTQFARSKAYGHFDALAALMYLVRNINTSSNPIPTNLGQDPDEYFYPRTPQNQLDRLRRAFGLTRHRRRIVRGRFQT